MAKNDEISLSETLKRALKQQQARTVEIPRSTSNRLLEFDPFKGHQVRGLGYHPSYAIDTSVKFIMPEQETLGSETKEYGMKSVTTIPLENETAPTVNTALKDISVDLQKLTEEVISQSSERVMKNLFEQIEVRTNKILAKAEKLAATNQVAIAIKINDAPLKKLANAAHPALARLVGMLKTGLLPLLVGPAGSGKTQLAGQAAEALELKFGHLCFSAGVSETWLFGRQTPTGFIEGEFSKFYRECGVFLADEMDAADANLLLAINTALANGHLYNPISGNTIARHKDFAFIGAANTYGKGGDTVYTGRSRLDAATLDRFTIIEIAYERAIEESLCPNKMLSSKLRAIRGKLLSRGSNEVVSYRAFDKAFKLHSLGMSLPDVVATLTASWPKNLLNELGEK